MQGTIVDGYVIVTNPTLIAERFANWPQGAKSVLKFTQKYGPLWSVPIVDGKFHINVEEWFRLQKRLQGDWRFASPSNLPSLGELGIRSYKELGRGVQLGTHTWMRFHAWGTELLLKDMWTLIEVCFNTIPLERLRVCTNPDCKRPYFVAHHLKQTLCNAMECKLWNSRRLKLEYWQRSKGPILEERKRTRKGEKNVTQKTR